MRQVYLLTGKPGTGKTSIIKEVVAGMEGKAGGFYTEEIRDHGVRQGFRLVTLAGSSTVLAHVNIRSPYRVSKYGVDLTGLDEIGVSALRKATLQSELVVVDEIGKMELYSVSFKEAVLNVIDSGKKVLGTVMFSPYPWTDAIKSRPQVKLVEVTRANHPQVLAELLRWLENNNSD